MSLSDFETYWYAFQLGAAIVAVLVVAFGVVP